LIPSITKKRRTDIRKKKKGGWIGGGYERDRSRQERESFGTVMVAARHMISKLRIGGKKEGVKHAKDVRLLTNNHGIAGKNGGEGKRLTDRGKVSIDVAKPPMAEDE